jgi:trans-aconitate methyltransferase
VLDALNDELRAAFLAAYAQSLVAVFKRREDGKTLLKFRRLFLVARA